MKFLKMLQDLVFIVCGKCKWNTYICFNAIYLGGDDKCSRKNCL